MIVAMQEHATEEQIDDVIEVMTEAGVGVHRTTGSSQTILAGVGPTAKVDLAQFENMPGVEHVHRISSPYKLAGRGFRPEGTIVEFRNGVKIGGEQAGAGRVFLCLRRFETDGSGCGIGGDRSRCDA